MCGRFALNETPRKLVEHFELSGDLELSPSWNIAPSTRIAVIVEGDVGESFYPHPNFPLASLSPSARGKGQVGGRHLLRMRWGLIPSWAKDAHASTGSARTGLGGSARTGLGGSGRTGLGGSARTAIAGLANARGETVAEKPSFRSAFKQRRCIIPASGFYEWKTVLGVKQPWYVSLKSSEPMAFAGLWETWHADRASIHQHERDNGEETITSCCIITTAANALMEPIHDRMPVILDRDQWATWLSPQVHEADKLLPLIRSHDSASMQAWPVAREVNRVGLRDDAGLVERVAV